MKKFLCAILMVVGVVGFASAAPFTWTDTIDFIPDLPVPPSQPYTHNIADSGFRSVFMGGDDTISSYELSISIYDDNQPTRFFGMLIPDGAEAATIWTNGGIYSYNFSLSSNTFTGNLIGVLDILADGTFGVTVSQAPFTLGDFYLAASTLTAHGDNGSAPVPEPATLLLLGAGLIGLAGYSRKRI
jgi:hypothetical protein